MLAPLGAGGMGEVYKARDTRLNRTVAIKVLPAHVAHDPDSRARFEREARAIAALSHPHICPLFDVGHQNDADFLVMEYLQGETLAERLRQGPLSLEQALGYAIEIADALDTAHRAGIIHRDLKPSNIMLTKGGVKLLDFGLAKLQRPAYSGAAGATQSVPLTGTGMILGTLRYMAPEQLEGKMSDHRADVFAFGAVLYEMLAGRKAFEASTEAGLIGAILKDQPPPLSASLPLVPHSLDHVVRRCLAKDPDERWQHAGDLKAELRWIADERRPDVAPAPQRRHASAAKLALLTAVVVAATLGILQLVRRDTSSPRHVTRLRLGLADGMALSPAVPVEVLDITADGRRIAYIAARAGSRKVYVHSLDSDTPTAVPGTEGATGVVFSPDGAWLAFSAEGKLKKIRSDGGTPVVLCDAPSAFSGSWTPQGRILFGGIGAAISEVSDRGGTPRRITRTPPGDNEMSYLAPVRLPDTDAVLLTVDPMGSLAVQHEGAAALQVLIEDARTPRLLRNTLVFARDGRLWAAPFVAATQTFQGEVRSVLDRVRTYALSENGTLVYVPGAIEASYSNLVWVDRNGREEQLPLAARDYVFPRLSPNAERLVMTVQEGDRANLWMYDLKRQTLNRFTVGPHGDWDPVWSPDGRRVYFARSGAGVNPGIYWKAVDGIGQVVPIVAMPNTYPASVTPDGGEVVVHVWPIGQRTPSPFLAQDIALLQVGNNPRIEPLINDPLRQINGMVSPDGRWIAYQSNETGRWEIYVRPFPNTKEGNWQVSEDGGMQPIWNKQGTTLFYRTLTGTIAAVPIESRATTFSMGKADTAFVEPFTTQGNLARQYDISADGTRMLALKTPGGASTYLNVVLNWDVELARTVAPR